MIKVLENLYIANQKEYEMTALSESEYSVLLAAKEPFHREALGYTGRAASKEDPEYLMAKRDNKLILNLVDAPKAEFFDSLLVHTGVMFIEDEISKGKKVVVVCNQGESRSASLTLLYLLKCGIINGDTLEDVEVEFLRLYPRYNPGKGIREFMKKNFKVYRK